MNHLLGFPAWDGFFGCVHDHLNDGGLFVFDIATIAYLMTDGQHSQDRAAVRRQLSADQGVHASMAGIQWQIEVFELQPDGRYRLLTRRVG